MSKELDKMRRDERDWQKRRQARIDSFTKDFKLFLDRSLVEIVEDLQSGSTDPAVALGGLIEAFRAKGLDSVINELSVVYGSEFAEVMDSLRSNGLDLQVVDTTTLEAFVRFKVEDIENRAVETIGSMRSVLLSNVITNTRPDIGSLINRFDSRLISYTETEVNTAIISFNRTVTAIAAEEIGVDRFIYIGPDDDVTRPFCAEVLSMRNPPIYSLDEIDAMDNGQGLDVLTSGGGWNCRHRWRPVSPALERQLSA